MKPSSEFTTWKYSGGSVISFVRMGFWSCFMGWTVALKMLLGEIWFCFWFGVSLLSGEYIHIYLGKLQRPHCDLTGNHS